jgi:prophage maintenance system killer protein
VIELEVADLVIIAERTLGLDTGQVLALLDPETADRAMRKARAGGDGGDAIGRAAALLHALVSERPLQTGNEQIALVATAQFLALNGWDVTLYPPESVRTLVTGLAAGTIGTSDVADWLALRVHPRCEAEPARKEALVKLRQAMPLAERLRKATMRGQPQGMFQRFTDRARRAVHLAKEEAWLLGHNWVGTEHLLLGLLYEGNGVAARALSSLGVSLDDVRAGVEEIIGRGDRSHKGDIPFTPRSKKVLELSLREALGLGHHYIGTEHILLALLREDEGVGAQILTGLGVDHATVTGRVLDLLNEREQALRETQLVRMAIPAELVEAAERLEAIRQQKQAAFDAGDLDQAAALRDRESQLLADKLRLERQLTAGTDVQAVIAENRRVHRELDRLRDLLRQHGIEPDGGAAKTA